MWWMNWQIVTLCLPLLSACALGVACSSAESSPHGFAGATSGEAGGGGGTGGAGAGGAGSTTATSSSASVGTGDGELCVPQSTIPCYGGPQGHPFQGHRSGAMELGAIRREITQ